MIQRGASVMLVTLLACGSDDRAAEHADATDVKATDSRSGLDTGWVPVTTYDPEACLEQLPPTAGDEMAVSDEARLVVWGADRDDTTGTSVACGSMDVGGLGPALVIGSPESSDLDEGPGGWLSVFDGTAQGETDIAAGDLVVRGAAQTRDRLGTFISLPGDVDADGLAARCARCVVGERWHLVLPTWWTECCPTVANDLARWGQRATPATLYVRERELLLRGPEERSRMEPTRRW